MSETSEIVNNSESEFLMTTHHLELGMMIRVKKDAKFAQQFSYANIVGMTGTVESVDHDDGSVYVKIFHANYGDYITWYVEACDLELVTHTNEGYLNVCTES